MFKQFCLNILEPIYKVYNRVFKKVKFGYGSQINIFCEFEGRNKIGRYSLVKRCQLGYGTYISDHSSIVYAKIGKYVSIGPSVRTVSGNHPTEKYVTTHPAFFSTRKQCGTTYVKKTSFSDFKFPKGESKYHVIIGNDVWIGDSALIMEGITIGDGAIIAAGSIVTKDVPPYAIVAGVPAHIKKYRFSEEKIHKLCKFKWWEKDEAWLKENVDMFSNIDKFINNIQGEICE